MGDLSGKKHVNSYLYLFVYISTKVVHLELATNLSRESFMNCFRRFVARRRLIQNIYSDNGTNFIGANRELRDL